MLSYPSRACTLKFNDEIFAYDSLHLTLATIEYNAYIHLKDFKI